MMITRGLYTWPAGPFAAAIFILLAVTFNLPGNTVTYAAASAVRGDDTLQFFLQKSQLVVEGNITSEPIGVEDQVGGVDYRFKFSTDKILWDSLPRKKPLDLQVLQVHALWLGNERAADVNPVRLGARLILFLALEPGPKGEWLTVDPWMGLVPDNWVMAGAIPRISGRDAPVAVYGAPPPLTVTIQPEKSHALLNESLKVDLHVKNTSHVVQMFEVMSCSWYEFWVSDNPLVSREAWNCFKNDRMEIKLKPGEVYEEILPVSISNSVPSTIQGWFLPAPVVQSGTAVSFRLGFMPMQSNFINWSNRVTVQID